MGGGVLHFWMYTFSGCTRSGKAINDLLNPYTARSASGSEPPARPQAWFDFVDRMAAKPQHTIHETTRSHTDLIFEPAGEFFETKPERRTSPHNATAKLNQLD